MDFFQASSARPPPALEGATRDATVAGRIGFGGFEIAISPSSERPEPRVPSARLLVLRSALGGALMGLANLVPGISGGTMLLATGVYPGFIGAIAEVTTLRLRRRSLLLLGTIVATAALAILLLAGPTRRLVIEQRWIMYSLFVGLTLGGVPIVWRLARPATPGVWAGAFVGLAAMAAMTWISPPGTSAGSSSNAMLFVAGLAGASAMVLPGVSGGYLLLLLGQYLPILAGVDALKQGLEPLASGGPPDMALARAGLTVAIPVGLGVVAGVVGVSNVVRWALARFPKPTLGILLGLLVGAVIGLWPFQRGVPPESLSPEATEVAVDPEKWPLERFQPDARQAGASLLFLGLGLVATTLVGRVGGDATTTRGR